MNLNMDFYPRVEAIDWLSHCGVNSRPEFGLPVQWVEDRLAALQAMFSTQWADATTVAQGRLTGYLAKHHYDSYAGNWNNLVKRSQTLLEGAIGKRLSTTLREGGWPASLAETALPEITPAVRASIGGRMADLRGAKAWCQCLCATILLDINLAAVELVYRSGFRKAPVFFERLLEVYEAGRLPCGWDGDLDDWPNGKLVVF